MQRSDEWPHFPPRSAASKGQLCSEEPITNAALSWLEAVHPWFFPAVLPCQWLYYFLNLCLESYLIPGQLQTLATRKGSEFNVPYST